MQHLDITVSGKVQGVFFRASTRAKAQELGVNGWVMNQQDGSVRIAAEADESIMQTFLAWLDEGPEQARVDAVQSQPGDISGFTNFLIK